MARRIVHQLVDDIDGTLLEVGEGETVLFSVDGVAYEIDLTAENAAYSKALVKPKPGERWLLVTSAQHMPRAMGAFRKAGFPVEAYPVDWRSLPRLRLQFPASFSLGLVRSDDTVHEWVGLFVYWITGRSSELLPGPAGR